MASKRPTTEQSASTISWRMKPEIRALLEGAAAIRGWELSRLLELGAMQLASEIVGDAARAMGRIRRANRKARARQGGLARAMQVRNIRGRADRP